MAISHIRWLRSGAPAADAVLAFAGRELARYVRHLTGERLRSMISAASSGIMISWWPTRV